VSVDACTHHAGVTWDTSEAKCHMLACFIANSVSCSVEVAWQLDEAEAL
jgi:hypothetical protein